MATRTDQQRLDRVTRNDLDLRDIAAMTEEIPETAAEWPNLADGERASFGLEWDNDMAGVEGLIREYYTGDLTPEQEGALYALLRRLQEVGPLLDGMGIRRPDLLGMEIVLGGRGDSAAR